MTKKMIVNFLICSVFSPFLTGCSLLDTEPQKRQPAYVIWKASDAGTASVALLNSFPQIPAQVLAANNFPVMPLTWTVVDNGMKQTVGQKASQVSTQPVAPDTRAVDAAKPLVQKASYVSKNTQHHALITRVSDEIGVDANLLHAVIKVESNYQPTAVSPKGARGLMQVMPATGKRFGYTNLINPEHNIRAGATYLKWLIEHFDNDLTLALAGYNAGEGAVKKYGRQIPPYKETQQYVKKVLAYYQQGSPMSPAQASPTAEPALEDRAIKEESSLNITRAGKVDGKALTAKLLGLLLSAPKNSTRQVEEAMPSQPVEL